MGYDLHITRADNWLDAKNRPISESDWQAVLAADPSLRVQPDDYFDRQADFGVIERCHPIEWLDAPDTNCLWFCDGAIECQNPSEEWVAKMVEIAERLGARVFGDDGEEYGLDESDPTLEIKATIGGGKTETTSPLAVTGRSASRGLDGNYFSYSWPSRERYSL